MEDSSAIAATSSSSSSSNNGMMMKLWDSLFKSPPSSSSSSSSSSSRFSATTASCLLILLFIFTLLLTHSSPYLRKLKYTWSMISMALVINPIYYDFFTRSLIPMKHYWPVNKKRICKSIKFAVDWGNKNPDKAQEIGKAGSNFIFEQIKMEYVYDYMFHVLNEYGKLLTYTPTVPEGAAELCSERFACSPMGLQTAYKIETMVHGPSNLGPCNLPPPYDPITLRTLRVQKEKIKEQVKMWESSNTWFNW